MSLEPIIYISKWLVVAIHLVISKCVRIFAFTIIWIWLNTLRLVLPSKNYYSSKPGQCLHIVNCYIMYSRIYDIQHLLTSFLSILATFCVVLKVNKFVSRQCSLFRVLKCQKSMHLDFFTSKFGILEIQNWWQRVIARKIDQLASQYFVRNRHQTWHCDLAYLVNFNFVSFHFQFSKLFEL